MVPDVSAILPGVDEVTWQVDLYILVGSGFLLNAKDSCPAGTGEVANINHLRLEGILVLNGLDV